MKIGDLVTISDAGIEDARGAGTILRFDMYNNSECIAEILWSNSSTGWILTTRLRMCSESG